MKKILFPILLLCSLVCSQKMYSQIFFFCKDIDGESTIKGHENETQLLSFTSGSTNAITIGSATGGAGAGRAKFSDITLMKPLGKSSFPLQKALLTGAHFTNAEIRFYKNAADPKDAAYYTIVLTNVFVSAFQSSGSGAEIPMESVSIAFASIQWKLILPTPANGISINPVLTWDVTKNAAQ